jgi:cephalosporin hydroxylase
MNTTVIITNTRKGHFEFIIPSSTGTTFALSQMTDIIPYFEKFLIDEQFDTIIEIGTYKGGFTILLDEIKQSNKLKFNIHTVDIGIWDENIFKEVLQDFNNRKITFHKTDIFSEAEVSYIKELLANPSKKVCVLCDGGDKISEFIYFSKLIKPGDFIMAHDYAHNSNNVDGLSYQCSWSWQEIHYTDISQSISTNNLEMNTDIRFPEVAWACYKKI